MAPGAGAVLALEDLGIGAILLIPCHHGVAVVVHCHLGEPGILPVRANVVGQVGRVAPGAGTVLALEDLGIGAILLIPCHHGVAVVVHCHLGVPGILPVRANVVRKGAWMAPGAGAVLALKDLGIGAIGLPPHHHGVAVVIHCHLGVPGILPVRANIIRKGAWMAPGAGAVLALKDLGIGAIGLPPHHHGVAVIIHRNLLVAGALPVRANVVGQVGRVAPGAGAVLALKDLVIGVPFCPRYHGIAIIIHRDLRYAGTLPVRANVVGQVGRVAPGAGVVLALEDLVIGAIPLIPYHHGVAAVVHCHLGVPGIRPVRANVVGRVGWVGPGAGAVLALKDLVIATIPLLPHHHGIAIIIHRDLGAGLVADIEQPVWANVIGQIGRVGPGRRGVRVGVAAAIATAGE